MQMEVAVTMIWMVAIRRATLAAVCLTVVVGQVRCSRATKSQAAQTVDVSVCALSSNAEKYDTARVRVRGVIHASLHGASLGDESCRNVTIALWRSATTKDSEEFKRLDRILYQQRPFGTADKHVIATFEGTFYRKTHEPVKRNVLLADEVRNVDATFNETPGPELP